MTNQVGCHGAEGPADAGARAVALATTARDAVAGLLSGLDASGADDDALLTVEALLSEIDRHVDAAHVRMAARILERSDTALGLGGLAARNGCANPARLIEKVSGVSIQTASRRVRVARLAGERTSETGLPLPPLFPHTAEALEAGTIGLETAESIVRALDAVADEAEPAFLDYAERAFTACSTGVPLAVGVDGEPDGEAPNELIPASHTELRRFIGQVVRRLDQDGALPAEKAMEKRYLRFIARADGMTKLDGLLPAEQYAIIRPVFEAFQSRRTAPVVFREMEEADTAVRDENGDPVLDEAGQPLRLARDRRTREQEAADVLTTVFEKVADLPTTPHLAGTGPTVLVVVDAKDLERGKGTCASPSSPTPLPLAFAWQAACAGGVQYVGREGDGTVTGITDRRRTFTENQRRQMIVRDGTTCIVDGCDIPVSLCEAHHIQEHAGGGRTEVSNGVLLCWFHHRMMDSRDWTVVFVDGRAQVAVPPWMPGKDHYRPRRPRPHDRE